LSFLIYGAGALLAPFKTVAPPELDGVTTQALPVCALGFIRVVTPVAPQFAEGVLAALPVPALGDRAMKSRGR
jgi:hypothetical protein